MGKARGGGTYSVVISGVVEGSGVVGGGVEVLSGISLYQYLHCNPIIYQYYTFTSSPSMSDVTVGRVRACRLYTRKTAVCSGRRPELTVELENTQARAAGARDQ